MIPGIARYVRAEEGGCSIWTGATNSDGYATVWDGKRNARVHRLVYEHSRGPIPDGLVLDHLCRNRACVNPDHLEPVTNRENVLRGESPVADNARKTSCAHGHPFNLSNTHVSINRWGNLTRSCRSCSRARSAKYRRRLIKCDLCGRLITRGARWLHMRDQHSAALGLAAEGDDREIAREHGWREGR